MSFTIQADISAAQALLARLQERTSNMRPVLMTIGETVVERTKRRFETGTGPDGRPWERNSAATIAMLAARIGGAKSNQKKDGSLNKRGQAVLANKRPLIGETGDLRRQFTQAATERSLTLISTPRYAAIQQFGGTTGARSWIPGKKIPARPFMPVRLDETLYPEEEAHILSALNDYLVEGL